MFIDKYIFNSDNESLIFEKIADNIKVRLAKWMGRPFIRKDELRFLKEYNFPFEVTYTMGMTEDIEISSLDTSPLVSMLKNKYGHTPKLQLIMRRAEIEEYAWHIVMSSTTYVFGG